MNDSKAHVAIAEIVVTGSVASTPPVLVCDDAVPVGKDVEVPVCGDAVPVGTDVEVPVCDDAVPVGTDVEVPVCGDAVQVATDVDAILDIEEVLVSVDVAAVMASLDGLCASTHRTPAHPTRTTTSNARTYLIIVVQEVMDLRRNSEVRSTVNTSGNK